MNRLSNLYWELTRASSLKLHALINYSWARRKLGSLSSNHPSRVFIPRPAENMPHIPHSNQPNHCLRRTALNDKVLIRPRSYDTTQNLTKQSKTKVCQTQGENHPSNAMPPSRPLPFFSPTHTLSLLHPCLTYPDPRKRKLFLPTF